MPVSAVISKSLLATMDKHRSLVRLEGKHDPQTKKTALEVIQMGGPQNRKQPSDAELKRIALTAQLIAGQFLIQLEGKPGDYGFQYGALKVLMRVMPDRSSKIQLCYE